MNTRLLAAFAALVALLSLFVSPVAAREGKHDATASVEVDCAANQIVITFEDLDGGFITYMVLAGDDPVVDKTTVELADTQIDVALPILDNGDYVVVFDDEKVIDKSLWSEPFTVDCPVPTPSPTPPPSTPPSNPPTTPPSEPPHKTLPPSDTISTTEVAYGDPSPLDNPVFWAGVFLIAVAIAGFAYETRKRRS